MADRLYAYLLMNKSIFTPVFFGLMRNALEAETRVSKQQVNDTPFVLRALPKRDKTLSERYVLRTTAH